MVSFKKGKKSEVTLKQLDFEEDEREEKANDCEKKDSSDDDGEGEPKEKQPPIKKIHSQIYAELKGKKVTKSGASSHKKKKTKEPSVGYEKRMKKKVELVI